MKSEIRSLYDFLLESGDLLDFFPQLEGEWAKDKKEFAELYAENQALIKGLRG